MRLYSPASIDAMQGVVDLKWANWRLRDGKLVSDDRVAEFTPGEVRAIPFMRMQIANYHKEQRLPRQGDWISETWVRLWNSRNLPSVDRPHCPLTARPRGGLFLAKMAQSVTGITEPRAHMGLWSHCRLVKPRGGRCLIPNTTEMSPMSIDLATR